MTWLKYQQLSRIKRIWYLSPMRAAKVQASLRIRAVSPEPPLLAHTSSESRGTFRQKARSLAPLNGWACPVKICHDGMLEDTNSLDRAQLSRDKKRDLRTVQLVSCFKSVCTAIQQGQRCGLLSAASSTSQYCVCEQRRLAKQHGCAGSP